MFDKNVFLNCPIDDEYREMLLGIVFTILYLGYNPRLSLERSDSSEVRITKILELIRESKFGIHDLSRIAAAEVDEFYRMNMPFELGIDYGCKSLKGGKWSGKKILVLESEQYRFQKALSDIAGSDIKAHQGQVDKAVIAVRDWLVAEDLGRGSSGGVVWDSYNDFQAFLYDEVVEGDGHNSVDEVQIQEVITLMREWFNQVA